MIKDLKQINNEEIICLAFLNSEVGFSTYEKKDYQKALSYLQDSFNLFVEEFSRIDVNQDAEGKIRENVKKHLFLIREKILEILNELGNSKMQNNDFYSAIDYYKQAIEYNSNSNLLYYNLGICLYKCGAYEAAVLSLEKALKLGFETESSIYQILGDIYIKNKNNPTKAIEYYNKFLEKNPDDYRVYNQLGHSYETLSQFENIDLQIKYFEKALELKPDGISALKNLALVYPRADKYQQALECYQKLTKLKMSMDSYFDYACFLIKLKNFEEGWKLYEHRFLKETTPTPYPKMKKPKWKGQKIQNQTILVQWEQGFGDTIHFVRYLEQLKEYANKIIFRVQNPMLDLIKSNLEGIEVIGNSTPIDDISFNFHIPLMSLPYLLNARVDNIPFTSGYIKADKEKSAFYKKAYFNNDCLKIGISWRGADVGNHLRNIPLETFYPLTKLKNVKVYSFQKEHGPEALSKLPADVEIIDLGSTFNNFFDTAAAMDNIDIFISSDNCVPNLASAMGKKTFLLLNKNSEWRWFMDEDKTPWYDSVTLIKKQNENDSWDILMQKVIDHLPVEVKN